MSLFDGKPLTEAEVNARAVCVCGHVYRLHAGGTTGTRCVAIIGWDGSCDCELFTGAVDYSAEDEQ